jgi:hypothetical protein
LPFSTTAKKQRHSDKETGASKQPFSARNERVKRVFRPLNRKMNTENYSSSKKIILEFYNDYDSLTWRQASGSIPDTFRQQEGCRNQAAGGWSEKKAVFF